MPSTYDFQLLETSFEDGVLEVRLNRPDDFNAINHDLHWELISLWREIRRDHDVRAVVLTGNGKAFSAGGNLKGPRMQAGPELDAFFQDARSIIVDLLEVPQPVVAAINGPAIGLGATLALLCDVTFMSRTAVIADPHVNVGVVAGDGGVIAWPWLVGMSRTKEYLFTGDRLSAQEAERIGLVNHAVEPEDLLASAHAFARRVADAPLLAVQGTKAVLNTILRDTANLVLDSALTKEKETFANGDHARAVEAFLAQRELAKQSQAEGK
ncbi:enoyl-CoA hydratase/isomerase family protein [Nocardioides sp. MAH-18]|uniref:Enoyl-CoA hydratase/isomerase family protein n=1 Tax=Nocardioides agri TaxID=2682843 RepID=A0A6L6XLN7_9ACTN|nr:MULTISPECIES: enoyl-CoA hydratase/isomerase family protein [unclassified Nocardioides]MBA2953225.1 enoyl-CoA hydratase/isomerase family protein [Nocardioides sp. CGMCC 1.13656]MVQ48094.1 enoyl-CoA hydratase/isomerase family protein [Nocardioides sp. MAH-18]